ncbi:protein max isoform X2 [Folsomia candida]|uniref:protein max isoform X2 n=1 Tax=Folsomia candida TaxID=158441 RepID=UPI000B902173|nr:protein max isoform X2 [Folsomia candida]
MLSDDDRDMDLDSDDDDFGLGDDDMGLGDKGNGAGTGKPMTQAEKRAHHNMLERKRRDHIKDSFVSLRDSVPSLQGEKTKQSSRAQILKKAAEYIQFMRRKNSAHQHDIEDLKRQNHVLENQIRALERARANGARPNGASPTDTKMSLKSSKGRGSESDNSDGEFRNMSSPESATSSSNTSSNPMPNGKKQLKVLNAAK